MIFTELRFLLLFIGCLVSFAVVPRRWRSLVLALWGAVFYLTYAGRFLPVVIVLTVLTLFSAHRAFAWLAGLSTVALLAYFKYVSMAPAIPDTAKPVATILVPLGFSYLSFELLHVMIERRRGRIPELKWPDLFAFVFFAPARIAGPIKRYPDFLASVRDAELSAENFYSGFVRILIGLAKKFLIADVLALTGPEALYVSSTRHAWTIMIAYSFQIYFDFSAYSDIAIGLARILGIRLPENFNWPYLAQNIRQFWERWHITLSQWVRDYIFAPLGRKLFRTPLRPWPAVIAAISYLVTFATVGAWHSLTAAFIAWGVYHGVLLTLYHIVSMKMPLAVATHRLYESRPARVIGTIVTFLFVTIGWVPFMLPIHDARRMLLLMFGGTP